MWNIGTLFRLAEIAESNRSYDVWAGKQADVAQKLYGIQKSMESIKELEEIEDKDRLLKGLQETFEKMSLELDPKNLKIIQVNF